MQIVTDDPAESDHPFDLHAMTGERQHILNDRRRLLSRLLDERQ
jgi:hypothetical protein